MHAVGPEQVEALLARMRNDDKAPKTISNAFKLLNQIFVFGKRKRWCRENPCELVDPPAVKPSTDIRFLNQRELTALLRAVDLNAKPFGPIDLALRWRDIDWDAGKIRVRRNYVRGHWVTPKSRRGSRFINGGTYVYSEVDERTHEELMNASSIGSYLNREIKGNFAYRKE